MRKDKRIYNEICGAIECRAKATKMVVLSADFSAYFCEICANELVDMGIGVIDEGGYVVADRIQAS
jgi:hypothetical protein